MRKMCQALVKLHECQSAEQVILESGGKLEEIPVDLNLITKKFGIITSEQDFTDIKQQLKDELDYDIDVLGCIFSDGNKLIIRYMEGLSITQNRYIVAHELGHAFHTDMQDGFVHTEMCIKGLERVDKDEKNADSFALELLIPRKALENLAINAKNNGEILKSKELAKKFDVSIEHMERMLKITGIEYIG